MPAAALGRPGREGVLILLAALVLFGLVYYAVRRRNRWGASLDERPSVIRAVTAVLAAAIAAGAAFWLTHLAGSPDQYAPAYAITAAVCAGALLYLAGTLIWHGRVALSLRWVGWVILIVPLLIPSTFSLALPIVAGLALTLRPAPGEPDAEPPAVDVLARR